MKEYKSQGQEKENKVPSPMELMLRAMGTAIRDARGAKKISQGELASRAGVSQTYLSFVERGMTFPQQEKLVDICSALDLDIVFKLVPKNDKKQMEEQE